MFILKCDVIKRLSLTLMPDNNLTFSKEYFKRVKNLLFSYKKCRNFISLTDKNEDILTRDLPGPDVRTKMMLMWELNVSVFQIWHFSVSSFLSGVNFTSTFRHAKERETDLE